MAFLTALVIFLILAWLVNLVFIAAIVRRLREQSQRISELENGDGGEVMKRAGATVDPFQASTVDDGVISRDGLTGRTLVSFFSPKCQPCRERLPAFVDYAAAFPGGRDQVLAVVESHPEEADELVSALSPVARVVVEADLGPVGQAFGVNGFPALCLVSETGEVIASGSLLDDLPTPATV